MHIGHNSTLSYQHLGRHMQHAPSSGISHSKSSIQLSSLRKANTPSLGRKKSDFLISVSSPPYFLPLCFHERLVSSAFAPLSYPVGFYLLVCVLYGLAVSTMEVSFDLCLCFLLGMGDIIVTGTLCVTGDTGS